MTLKKLLLPKQSYKIIQANGEDPCTARIILGMHESVFGDSAPQVKPDEGYWWIAWRGNEPAGFAGLRFARNTPGTASLHRAGVLRAHRGNGLQVKLIRAREIKAKAMGMTRMVSDTTENIHSANSLIRAGYRMFDSEYKWGMDNTLYWERDL